MGSKSLVAAPLQAHLYHNADDYAIQRDNDYNSNSALAGFCCPYVCLPAF
jgi:hypothetical protein